MRTFALVPSLALCVLMSSPALAITPSAGCAKPDRLWPANYTQATWPIDQTGFDGTTIPRTYSFHVPWKSFLTLAPAPIVLNLHPSTSNGALHEWISRMNIYSETEGFIAVHPNSLGDPTAWVAFDEWAFARNGFSDVDFVNKLLEVLDRETCFDRDRIYSTGYSSGGFMSGRLACASARGELGPFKLAAIAPVSATHMFSSPADECPELATDPVPVRVIISNYDVTLEGLFRYAFNPDGTPISMELSNQFIRELSRLYATSSGCSPTGEAIVASGRTGWGVLVETTTFDCSAAPGSRAEVILDIFDSTLWGRATNGHIWPGGRIMGGEYNATTVIWEFFKARSR